MRIITLQIILFVFLTWYRSFKLESSRSTITTMTTAVNSKKNDLLTSVSVKLDINNFPLWRSLVLPVIRGCKLDDYILGTKECPQEFITVADSNKTKNPSFEEWVADDQMLLGGY